MNTKCTKDSVRQEEVLVALRRIIRAVDLHSRRLIQKTGLSGPQLVLLQIMGQGETVTAGELARRASLSQATVTTILDRLEERGLVSRKRSTDDKRRVHVALTDPGSAALVAAPRLLQDNFVKAFAALPDWEQHLLIASLERVAQMMNAADLDASPYLHTGELVG
jgi:DNA-binding MarR family transcriptional regulator